MDHTKTIRQRMREEFNALPPDQRACWVEIVTQEWIMAIPYYSKIQIAAVVAGAGPFTYTVVRGTVLTAFSYSFNFGTAEAAGFPANYIARLCDTNLGKPQETISGETVEIHGIAIMPVGAWVPDRGAGINSVTDEFSDTAFMTLCSDAMDVQLNLNAGQQDYRLGIFPMLPGAGGLFGAGNDDIGSQPLPGGRPQFSNMVNGSPRADVNFFELPEGVNWNPSGKKDSQLAVPFTFCRNVIAYSGGNLDNTAALGVNEAPAAGIRGYTYPTKLGFGLMIHLKGRVISERSDVS